MKSTRKIKKRGGGGCIGRKCVKNKEREEQEKKNLEKWKLQREKNHKGLLELKEFYLTKLEILSEEEENDGKNHTESIIDAQDKINQLQLLLDLYEEQKTPRVIIGRTGKKTRRVR